MTGERMRYTAVSCLVVVLMLLVVAIGVALPIYLWCTGFLTSTFGEANKTQTGFVRVEAVKAGLSFATIYIRTIVKLYEKVEKVKPRLAIVGDFIHPRAKELVKRLGVDIYGYLEETIA